MTTILLVRHGENDWVKKHRLAGWIEGIHLNENGRQQAADAAERLAALPIKAIYSSPVLRCRETADCLGPAEVFELERGPALVQFGHRLEVRPLLVPRRLPRGHRRRSCA